MLLEKGYKVRGSVRSLSNDTKVKHLKESFPGLELVRVAATLSRHCPARCPRAVTHPHPGRAQVEADLLTPGSFDAGIDGCDYVMHTASPFQIAGITDPQKELVGGFFSFVRCGWCICFPGASSAWPFTAVCCSQTLPSRARKTSWPPPPRPKSSAWC